MKSWVVKARTEEQGVRRKMLFVKLLKCYASNNFHYRISLGAQREHDCIKTFFTLLGHPKIYLKIYATKWKINFHKENPANKLL